MTKAKKGFSDSQGKQVTGKPGKLQVTVKKVTKKKDGRANNGSTVNLNRSGRKAADEITDAEVEFIENYLFHFNKANAVREAGFDTKNPSSYANELLSRPRVAAYLEQRRAEIREERKDIHNRITNELCIIAFSDTSHLASLKTPEKVREELIAGGMPAEEAKKLSVQDLSFDRLLKGRNGHLIKSLKQGRHGIEFQLHSKDAALDMLAKHTGYYEADNNQKNKPSVQIYIPDNGRAYTEESDAQEK